MPTYRTSQRHDAPRGAVEQRAHVELARTTRTKVVEEVRDREAGVDEILDEDDVAAAQIEVDVVEDADPPGVGRVAGDGDEVDGHLDRRQRARQVGEEDQRALQHAHEHDAVGMVGRDLGRDAGDALVDGGLVEQRRPARPAPCPNGGSGRVTR